MDRPFIKKSQTPRALFFIDGRNKHSIWAVSTQIIKEKICYFTFNWKEQLPILQTFFGKDGANQQENRIRPVNLTDFFKK
jgi:hypothetical protein